MNHSREYVDLLIKLHRSIDGNGTQLKIWQKFEQRAREFSRVDWTESLKIARRHRAKPKQCFANCHRISLAQNLDYHEGFCTHLIPFEHAWLVRADGAVIDPTLCLSSNDPEPTVDFFGILIGRAELLAPRDNPYEPTWLQSILPLIGDQNPCASKRLNN